MLKTSDILLYARNETPHTAVAQIATGHFSEKTGYAAWRTHGTDDWLLIATLGEQGRFGHESGQIVTETGDMVLLRPGTRHDYGVAREASAWELLWAHFQPRAHWHEWLNWPEAAPGLMCLSLRDMALREKAIARFFDAHHQAAGALRQREPFALNALEEVLLWCDLQNPLSEQQSPPLDGRVREAMDYLCRNLQEKITLDTLAAVSGLSVSRLAHLFRAQVGTTPQQFLEMQRLSRAKQLLELTPRTIQSIASEVGFDNPFYFSLRFKQHTGLSPRDYRRRASGPLRPRRRDVHPIMRKTTPIRFSCFKTTPEETGFAFDVSVS